MTFKGLVQNGLLESEKIKWNKESGTILLEKKKIFNVMGVWFYVHTDLFICLHTFCWYKKLSSIKALSANSSSFVGAQWALPVSFLFCDS